MKYFRTLHQTDNFSALVNRLSSILCRTSPRMRDVANNIICLLEHPIVAPGDGVMWMDGLNPLWEHGVGVVVIFRFLAGHIGQHDGVLDVRIFLL